MTSQHFQPTRWTLVLRARGKDAEAKAALSDLCGAYYSPVVAFLRRDGRSEDAARELAHGFFESVLSGGLGAPVPERGKFRSYLLGALKHFLAKTRTAILAEKRGGGSAHVAWTEENETGAEDSTLAFDQEWAFTLIARALTALEDEHSEKPAQFAALKPWLNGAANTSQTEAARALGMTETALKVAIHRLRVRFRELIRAEIAATVNDPADAADELRHLIAIASAGESRGSY